MKAADRRKAIVNLLLSEEQVISGSVLAERFGVSRQIIVQDITILKSSGYDILSTHNGYVIQKSPLKERVFKVHHTTEQTIHYENRLRNREKMGGVAEERDVGGEK